MVEVPLYDKRLSTVPQEHLLMSRQHRTGHHAGLIGQRGAGIGAGLGGGRAAWHRTGHHAGLIGRRGAGIGAGLGGGRAAQHGTGHHAGLIVHATEC